MDPSLYRGRLSPNKGKTYPAEILTPDEVRRLAAQCSRTSSSGIQHRALIVLLYRTGLRISEALALRIKDIDFEIGAVTVLHGKGDRRRTVGIDPGADEHILVWIDRRRMLGIYDPAPLFCTLDGGVLRRSEVSEMLHRLAREAGITKRVHPHGSVTRTPTSWSRTMLVVFVVFVWALELWWSKAWMSRFRFGPTEWVWRAATYRRLP